MRQLIFFDLFSNKKRIVQETESSSPLHTVNVLYLQYRAQAPLKSSLAELLYFIFNQQQATFTPKNALTHIQVQPLKKNQLASQSSTAKKARNRVVLIELIFLMRGMFSGTQREHSSYFLKASAVVKYSKDLQYFTARLLKICAWTKETEKWSSTALQQLCVL